MLTTTNYQFKKIELKDSPPDITVINPNWDAIDTELKKVNEQLGEMENNKQAKIKLKTGSDFTTSELANGEIGIVY